MPPVFPFPGTDQYTTVTVSGLYDNNSESPLFAANGTAAPTSGILVGSVDSNGNFQPLSSTPDGFLNVNATFAGTTTVQGTLSNNTAAPIADNLGTLGYIAATSYTTNTYTNGFQVLGVTDLHGAVNEDLQAVAGVQLGATAVVAFGSAPAAVNVPAVNSSIFSGTTSITNTAGSLNVNVTNTVPVSITGQPIAVSQSGTWTVIAQGEYTNNTTATSTITDQFAVLPAIAATAYATNTWTTGNQVVLTTDLHGAINNDMQAVAGVAIGPTSVVNFGSSPAAAPVQAVNSSIFSGTVSITNTAGSLNVNVTNTVPVTVGNTVTVKGEYTNNTTATSTITDQFAVLGAEANAASPSWTEGDQVVMSVDLTGRQRVRGTLTNNNAAPTADNIGAMVAVTNSGTFPAVTLPAYTAGDQELLRVSQGGSLVTIPADEEYASSINYYADSSSTGVSPALTSLATATIVPLISIQSNSAAFNFMIREVQAFGDGSQAILTLYKNPTLTGAAFTATGIPTGSHIKRDVTATAVTAGQVVWTNMQAAHPVHEDSFLLALAAGAPGDTYTLAATKIGTGTSKAWASIRWSEEAAAI